MIDRLLLSASAMNNVLAIRNAQSMVDLSTLRLSTGRKVNSALDNPMNFFTARALDNRASDLMRLLDGIGSSIRAVEEASNGVSALTRLLNLAESDALLALEKLRAGSSEQVVTMPLSDQILAANPIGYWRLNETAGTVSANLGSLGGVVNATYVNGPILGAAPLYDGGGTSVYFDGIDDQVTIPNHPSINTTPQPLRSVELVFNADTTMGRQVLYEEGGTTNSFSIYIFNGSLYVNARNSTGLGPLNISAPIVAGQTYHVGFTFDAPNGVFRAYMDGMEIGNAVVTANFPSHTGNVGIGHQNNGTWYHDGSQGGDGNYFNGHISDVGMYNAALTAQQMEEHAAAVTGVIASAPTSDSFDNILDQIDKLVRDAHYRGVNLLMAENLTTYFNETGSSKLSVKGEDFTSRGLGIKRVGFDTESGIEEIIISIRAALNEVRGFGGRLANNLNILKIRDAFTRETVNVLKAGASSLTDADPNEEGANLLAAQTRLELATISLSVGSRSSAGVLDLFA